jgi:hypothetical protein
MNTNFTQTTLSTNGAAVAKAFAPISGTARPSANVDRHSVTTGRPPETNIQKKT